MVSFINIIIWLKSVWMWFKFISYINFVYFYMYLKFFVYGNYMDWIDKGI